MHEFDPLLLLFWGLVTFATPLVLLFIPYIKEHISQKALHIMLGFSAGLLGGITFIDILPEAFEYVEEQGLSHLIISAGVAIGLFLPFIIERHMLGSEKRHSHAHMEDDREIRPMGTLAISALAIHGVVDGFVIPIGFSAGAEIGTVITLAIALHQIPDSFSAATIGIAAGYDRRKIAMFMVLTALDTPVGIVIGYLFLGAGTWIIPLGFGLTAGTFIFVSAADLIPELQHRTKSVWVTMSIIMGFAFVGVLSLWIHV